MLFTYKALDTKGEEKEGSVEAVNIDVAISSVQKRGLILSSIAPAEAESKLRIFRRRASMRDIVILSRQLSTLFDAQVSALRIFKLMAAETENQTLRRSLTEVADDLQGGSSISNALSKHPAIFSEFYVNMVKAGEETGKLNDTFGFLADYLDRNYEVVSKARNALIYPAFVITVFIGVMVLMFTTIVPKIAAILKDSGQELPIYTKIVIGISDFFVNYGIFLAAAVVIGAVLFIRYARTPQGKFSLDSFKLNLPYIGDLYRKLYLSMIADNMHTMVVSGIPMLRAIEITGAVVGSEVYRQVLNETLVAVKGGSPLSTSLSQYAEIPGIMVQMVKVGEETGELGNILKTLAKFYQREVMNAVDTLVSLIEPVMIVLLGLGVGLLLASVLLPIYNIASTAA
ncbi:type II secretion system F family protein [Patescibacteria group bacterium]|nr:MAG: type II secretion system F family protein [Patescibacteria group bacterium]